MKIVQHFLEKHPCYQFNVNASEGDNYKVFQANGPQGVVLYLFQEVSVESYLKERDQAKYTECPHCILDGDNEMAVQLLPWNYRGWHGPHPYNDTHVGIGIFVPQGARLIGRQLQIEDSKRASKSVEKVFDSLLFLLETIFKQYQLDLSSEQTILTCSDVYNRDIDKQSSEPFVWWALADEKYSLDYLKQELSGRLAEKIEDKPEENIEALLKDEGEVNNAASDTKSEDQGFSSYNVKVKVDSLNYREGPGIDHKIVGAIKDKGVYLIVDEKRGWGKIDRLGWIHLMHTQKI